MMESLPVLNNIKRCLIHSILIGSKRIPIQIKEQQQPSHLSGHQQNQRGEKVALYAVKRDTLKRATALTTRTSSDDLSNIRKVN